MNLKLQKQFQLQINARCASVNVSYDDVMELIDKMVSDQVQLTVHQVLSSCFQIKGDSQKLEEQLMLADVQNQIMVAKQPGLQEQLDLDEKYERAKKEMCAEATTKLNNVIDIVNSIRELEQKV